MMNPLGIRREKRTNNKIFTTSFFTGFMYVAP